ncbi:OLC1v1012333C1 [Oldenlandia corymbosa var. corymbosa]|uniref:OLC1v1012333C1 n=1 Tax=Oldenlandia corymbosa var. corymbosa TaxID=529605 RepID=A0AAV1DXI2_OLDCO|nr:OLC1v1012333C1 [Oldenlandia corymbosa var. corymbosa]
MKIKLQKDYISKEDMIKAYMEELKQELKRNLADDRSDVSMTTATSNEDCLAGESQDPEEYNEDDMIEERFNKLVEELREETKGDIILKQSQKSNLKFNLRPCERAVRALISIYLYLIMLTDLIIILCPSTHTILLMCTEFHSHFVTCRSGRQSRQLQASINRFEELWTKFDECRDIIEENWYIGGDVNAEQFKMKIKNTMMALKKWGKLKFGNLRKKINDFNQRLVEIQGNPAYTWDEEAKLKKELELLLEQEEVYWKQRSRISWLQGGDRNTSYFHNKASHRKTKNFIRRLQAESGEWIEDEEKLHMHIIGHFAGLFTERADYQDDISNLVESHIPRYMIEELEDKFTEEEIIKVIKDMRPWKAPGPDGVHAGFYQIYWSIVGDDVKKLALDILDGDGDIQALNHTYIVLIPKVLNPPK